MRRWSALFSSTPHDGTVGCPQFDWLIKVVNQPRCMRESGRELRYVPPGAAEIVIRAAEAKLGTAHVQRAFVVPRQRAVAALGLGVTVGSAVPTLRDLRAEGVAEAAEAGVAVAARTLEKLDRGLASSSNMEGDEKEIG
jgi:hypothetical protein